MSEITNITPNRKKIIESIVYFSRELKCPSKTMMYKVLAELDYRHFKETGLPVTHFEYFAWEWGPVPKKFDAEISDRVNKTIILPDDFTSSLYIEEENWIDKNGKDAKTLYWRAKRKPNLDVFSPRQLRILEDVAFIYKEATATKASDASHERQTPWYKTNVLTGKEGQLIDFFKILPEDTKIDTEEVKERIDDIVTFRQNYKA